MAEGAPPRGPFDSPWSLCSLRAFSLIDGLPLAEEALQALARQLKNKCGTGGTVKNGVIEIQGDHRAQLQPLLEAQGYTVKLAGA